SLFRSIENTKGELSVIIGLLTLVATLNIAATLVVLFLERDREVAILQALGMSPGQIVQWVGIQGILLGLISSSFGLLLGRVSGSGKATFLHCLGLLERPESGHVEWKGKDLSSLSEAARAEFRLKNVGYIFQFHHLIPELTALENVTLPSSLLGGRDDAWGLE